MSDTPDLVRIHRDDLGTWGPVSVEAFEFRYKADGWEIAPDVLPTPEPDKAQPEVTLEPAPPEVPPLTANKPRSSRADKES